MIINKQDTDGTKPLLAEGELGYDKQGTDRGRVYVGGNGANIPLAKKSEVDIHSATSKATPTDSDEIGLIDSVSSWVLKKLTLGNLKATLKTYLDTLYIALSGNQTITGVKSFSENLLVGTTIDNGVDKLQVNGSISVYDEVRIFDTKNTETTYPITIEKSFAKATLAITDKQDFIRVLAPDNYSQGFVEVEFSGMTVSGSIIAFSVKRLYHFAGGVPSFTTIGSDYLLNCTITFTADPGNIAFNIELNQTSALVHYVSGHIKVVGGGSDAGAYGVSYVHIF